MFAVRNPANTYEHLFRLRVRLEPGKGGTAVIDAWSHEMIRRDGKSHVVCQLRFGGRTIFDPDHFAIGMPGCVDDDSAKASVLGWMSVKPGDTDAEFFDDFTPEQLEFVEHYGEELSLVRELRFGEGS